MLINIKQIICCMLALSHMQLFSYSYDFVQYHMVDTSRAELYPHDDTHPYRELLVHVWIPIAKKSCPLILFSHGLGDNFNGMMYTRLCQYCASCGYVVVSVSHSYGCKSIQFPDGRIAQFSFPALFHQQAGRHVFDVEADIWLNDMIYVLNECIKQNADEASLLYQKIDESRVGIMGHSLGGGVAINAGRKDDRIKAIINLDGPLFGAYATIPIEKPLLMLIGSSVVCNPASIFSGGVPFHKEFVWRYYFNQQWLSSLKIFAASSPQAQIVYINKIVHGSFSDEALYADSVIAPFVLSGEQAHTVIYSYVRDFFDKYL